MEITQNKLEQLLLTAADIAVKQFADKLGLEKKRVSRTQAYKMYGKYRVDQWRSEGAVTPVKQGKVVYFSKIELETQASLDKLSERICHE